MEVVLAVCDACNQRMVNPRYKIKFADAHNTALYAEKVFDLCGLCFENMKDNLTHGCRRNSEDLTRKIPVVDDTPNYDRD